MSKEEIALGEMLYDDYHRYSDECNMSKVINVMKKIETGKHTKLEKKTYDALLIELASKRANKNAQVNLEKAEHFLDILKDTKSVFPIVDKKVYVEILQQGFGEEISSESVVSIYFKQYDETGKIIKDTGEKEPYTVALSKMIKGFKLGMSGARIGERRKIYIHPSYGFGKISAGHLSNQLLIYEVVLVGVNS